VEWLYRSASELAQQIRTGQVSSAEVTEAHIRQIEAVNPRLNAVVVPLYDQAMATARSADLAKAKGTIMGPLHGVPITIKECHDVTGAPSTAGLPGRVGHRAARDMLMVARLRAAGAVILGKTNIPQVMLYFESDNPVYGRTNNPWDLERTPGGSSGGESAIIAAGGSPLGLGSDIGGSIRIPAHFTGICGIMPTARRLTEHGSADLLIAPGMDGLVCQPGPLARHVQDLKLAMSILAAPGQELVDPKIPPVPWPDPDQVQVKGLRVGFIEDDLFLSASPSLRRAVREAAAALEGMGAIVQPFTPPEIGEAMRLFTGIFGADGGAWIRPLIAGGAVDKRIATLVNLAKVPGPVRSALAAGIGAAGQVRLKETMLRIGNLSTGDYWQLIHDRDQYRIRYLSAMEAAGLDLLICPPFMTPALKHGTSEYLNAMGSYAQVWPLLGFPGGTVAATRVRPGEETDRPASRDLVDKATATVEQGSAGLPIGVQVVARPWREDLVLAVMEALEGHFRQQPDYPARPPT